MLRLLGLGLGWIALGAAVSLLLLGFTVGAFAVVVLSAPVLGEEYGTAVGLSLLCVGLPISFVLAVATHELGHVFAGACAGFRPQFAHIGPITFTRRAGRWRLGWDGRQSWLGGRAVCARRPGSRARVAAFLLAGPSANLVTGVAAAVWFADAGSPALPRCWAGLFAVQSLFFSVVNLVPVRYRRLDSDGLALCRLFAGCGLKGE
ncbi:hypothetical protein GobsT_22570 [Gemmata obscuriglobus]|uniref:Peptidase M50 domain-containing protein n=1 Tax=Gemmata obscuriglobus TaxID=114 RepID=A0A2Z3HDQ3_9BACT|nr:hypothetical protein [Gemmata obscuriglobus]AWM39420.1 hypothetical protein C1280_22140 [Gemmata obscuriglobus]QEG27501.1 hypothetical protein GobsT_22570 [Gemmata obscuriglobus]VTS04521.1 Uncharacterized protein OS=Bacillus cellulosilyticus (strain ATCC 21833 / DSM 2522 / FERM P-1141 / JCM 9156 / N-4) GN=Bcell_0631 PE=4 SV=1 [Gemmata obscuriglobus UQM 2246]